ncbi:MAG: cytochrome P450 [Rhodococcus sp. (in: high G+C Gram-positive bacteria)]
MSIDVLGTMDAMAEEYGNISRLNLGPRNVVVLRGNDAVKHVLVSHQDRYPKSPNFDLFRPILGNGLVTSSGSTWRRSRAIAGPVFAKRHLGVYADHMAAAADDAVTAWDGVGLDRSEVDLDGEMLRVGLDTVFRALISGDISTVDNDLGSLMAESLHEIGRISRSLGPMLLQDVDHVGMIRAARVFTPRRWRRYTTQAKGVHAVMESLVDDRFDHGQQGRNDLMSLLMDSADPDTGEFLSRQQVIDEVATFIAAGHETTAHGLAWMFYLLGHHPDAREQLDAELDRVLKGQLPGVDDADRLPWLTACFNEAMRLYPPVWHIPRTALHDDVIAGHFVPAGSRIMVSVWSTHRDPTVYERPTEFLPDRWMNGAARDRPRFSYLPFGGGRRACIGQSFANLNAVLLGAVVAQRYHFDTDPTVKVSLEPTITLRPHRGLAAIARRRPAFVPVTSTPT